MKMDNSDKLRTVDWMLVVSDDDFWSGNKENKWFTDRNKEGKISSWNWERW